MAEADARVEAAAFRVLSPGARRVLAAIMSEIGEGDHATISVNSHGGIPANRNPRMRLPRIDRFAYQL
jgi:hypothetical protein